MKLIVGLGNPGTEYLNSRHNIGFVILDSFAQKRKMSFKKDGNSLIAKRPQFMLLKPQTYMNLSGRAISRFISTADEILVICDDIYLPLGEVRLRQSGGDGGHNGLASIIYELDTDQFNRMRIGVGQPETLDTLRDYVLEDFSQGEVEILTKTSDFALKLIDCFISGGFQSMVNHYSKNKKSYSEGIASESKTKGGI